MYQTSTHEVIVVRVAADPKPEDAIGNIDPQGPVEKTDAHCAKPAHSFKMKGWMVRVVFQQEKAFIGKFLCGFG